MSGQGFLFKTLSSQPPLQALQVCNGNVRTSSICTHYICNQFVAFLTFYKENNVTLTKFHLNIYSIISVDQVAQAARR